MAWLLMVVTNWFLIGFEAYSAGLVTDTIILIWLNLAKSP